MQFKDIDFDPAARILRQFAAALFVVLCSFAIWHGWHGQTLLAAVLAATAIVFALVGIVKPRWLRWVFVAASVVTFPIGWLMSRIILAIVYYGVFTPVAMVFRLIGRDELRLNKPKLESYWIARDPETDPRRYLRQF
jgi:hypothetical protein